MSKIAIAKPIVWEHTQSKYVERPWQEWHDSRYGYHIEYDPGEDKSDLYIATWGEGDPESFETLAEAQEWCQDEMNSWVADNVLIVDAPVESEGKQ